MELEVVEPAKPAVKFEADPLISFIVPVHAGHLDKSVFKRCLMSLDDQDYENFEVVIVLNGGEDKGIEDTAAFYVNKDSRFRLIRSEAGACVRGTRGLRRRKGKLSPFLTPIIA
jgi:cellulose synthase/poly-beta-1,6-N-acetylglucosamine synthase-like glycosyltransferase